jgi:hypothetical protein
MRMTAISWLAGYCELPCSIQSWKIPSRRKHVHSAKRIKKQKNWPLESSHPPNQGCITKTKKRWCVIKVQARSRSRISDIQAPVCCVIEMAHATVDKSCVDSLFPFLSLYIHTHVDRVYASKRRNRLKRIKGKTEREQTTFFFFLEHKRDLVLLLMCMWLE